MLDEKIGMGMAQVKILFPISLSRIAIGSTVILLGILIKVL